MKVHVPYAAALVVAAALAGSAGAQDKKKARDIAELLPARALLSVEVCQPQRLAREVAALVKGSALEDMPAVLARFRTRLGDKNVWSLDEVGSLGMFLSPEILREAGRVRGGAAALTGFGKDGPEYLVVLQPGESVLLPLMMRGMTTFNRTIIIGEVGGTPIYRERRQVYKPWKFKPGEKPPPPTWEERGPAIAVLPRLIVLASNKELVRDTVLRARGKSSDGSLAGVAAYKESARRRSRPGLFFYSDTPGLFAVVRKASEGLPRHTRDTLAALQSLFNPKAVKSATALLSLQNGALRVQKWVTFDPKEKSPILAALPDKKVDTTLLRFAPRDSLLAVIRNAEDGARHFKAAMTVLDAVARAQGAEDERLPSRQLATYEEKVKVNLGKDVFARLSAAGGVLGRAGKMGRPSPLLLVRATDADAAGELEKVLPRLLGSEAAAGEMVLGQSVTALATRMTPPFKAIHVGHKGAVLVIGPDKMQVARALAGAGKKQGLLSDPRVAAELKEIDSPVLVGVGNLGAGVTALFRRAMSPRVVYRKTTEKYPPGEKPPSPPKPPTPEYLKKGLADMDRAARSLAPVVFGLRRTADSATFELRLPGLRRAVPRLINVWVETGLQRAVYHSGPPSAGVKTPKEASEKTPAPKPIEKKPIEKKPIEKK
jgi:hypothetical protein